MKTVFLNTIAILIFSIFLSSCTDEAAMDMEYSLNEAWLSLGITDTDYFDNYDFIVYCDNGDTLYPITTNFSNFEIEHNQRVLVNYTILDNFSHTGKEYFTRINSIQEVLFKSVIERTVSNSKSLGNNPATITDVWIIKDMLNIEFKYKGNGYDTHSINLAYDKKNDSSISNPVTLYFLHNNNNDEAEVLLNGIVTFDISTLQKTDINTIELEIINTNLEGEEQTTNQTYTY